MTRATRTRPQHAEHERSSGQLALDAPLQRAAQADVAAEEHRLRIAGPGAGSKGGSSAEQGQRAAVIQEREQPFQGQRQGSESQREDGVAGDHRDEKAAAAKGRRRRRGCLARSCEPPRERVHPPEREEKGAQVLQLESPIERKRGIEQGSRMPERETELTRQ
jgi:hypothetical protein